MKRGLPPAGLILRVFDDEKGASMAITALLLPVWLALAGLVIDGGYLMWVNSSLQTAADQAALAAAQNIDIKSLGRGDPALLPDETRIDAHHWLQDNLVLHPATAPYAATADATVWVMNGKPEEPVYHPLTGRKLTDPTVGIKVTIMARGIFWTYFVREVPITVAADASIMSHR